MGVGAFSRGRACGAESRIESFACLGLQDVANARSVAYLQVPCGNYTRAEAIRELLPVRGTPSSIWPPIRTVCFRGERRHGMPSGAARDPKKESLWRRTIRRQAAGQRARLARQGERASNPRRGFPSPQTSRRGRGVAWGSPESCQPLAGTCLGDQVSERKAHHVEQARRSCVPPIRT